LISSVEEHPKRRGKAKGRHVEKRLSASFVKSAPPGRHTDGGGLYLVVDKSGAKRWLLRVVVEGRRRDIGLGAVSLVKLADVRAKAQEFRSIARSGGDPLAEARREQAASITFDQVAEEYHRLHVVPSATNGKHVDQWINTLSKFASPKIGHIPVGQIRRPDIISVLEPIWWSKQETGRRLSQRMHKVFNYAIIRELRTAANPVEGIKDALPKQTKRVKHFSAMPWHFVPDFYQELREYNGVSAVALRFAIVTASRSGPIRHARWNEIQQFSSGSGTWHVPASNMKGRENFEIPLCTEAINVLRDAEEYKCGPHSLIFPSPRDPEKPLSDAAMRNLLQSYVGDYTVHGFRSSFRDWAEENTAYSEAVKEAALAHLVTNKTVAAYKRTQHLEKRRDLMQDWAGYLTDEIDIDAPEIKQAVAFAIGSANRELF